MSGIGRIRYVTATLGWNKAVYAICRHLSSSSESGSISEEQQHHFADHCPGSTTGFIYLENEE